MKGFFKRQREIYEVLLLSTEEKVLYRVKDPQNTITVGVSKK